MSKIENALGKTIRITNTPNYARLAEMYEPITGLDYMTFENLASEFGSTLGAKMNCSREDVKYLFTLTSLRSINGGDLTLQTINNAIADPTKRISYYDIVVHNLESILGADINNKYPIEEKNLVSQILSGKTTSPEVLAVTYGRLLTIIKEGLVKKEGISTLDANAQILNEINGMAQEYNTNGTISLSEKAKACLSGCTYSLEATPEDLKALGDIASDYTQSQSSKAELINKLNEFHFANEKKTGLTRR